MKSRGLLPFLHPPTLASEPRVNLTVRRVKSESRIRQSVEAALCRGYGRFG
jgi:hypothetical protein